MASRSGLRVGELEVNPCLAVGGLVQERRLEILDRDLVLVDRSPLGPPLYAIPLYAIKRSGEWWQTNPRMIEIGYRTQVASCPNLLKQSSISSFQVHQLSDCFSACDKAAKIFSSVSALT